MVVHLLKISVGTEDVEHLRRWQSLKMQRSLASGQGNRLWHRTRHMPRRGAEVLDGGSIYWIIRRFVRARQRIIGLEPVVGEDGITRCDLVLDPELVRTEPQPRRPHQGWRYLDPGDAPRDLDVAGQRQELSDDMAMELSELGLL